MFLRLTDFGSGVYRVPNVTGFNYDPVAFGNTQKLQSTIDEYEPKALVTILGLEMFKEIKELVDLDNENRLKSGADEKWNKLVNGDAEVVFGGIIKALTSYVYYYYLQDTESELTTTGVKEIESKSAKIYSIRHKMVSAWNDFKREVLGIGGNEINVRFYFNNMPSIEYSNPIENTIHGYIIKNIDLYTNFKPSTIGDVNQFDI